jgi:circadian clock protein KaiC
VILLDHRVTGQISTRRLRVVKYRGSTHGTNEYPFLIDEEGISVLPITATGMNYGVSNRRIPTGIPEMDSMLGGGLYEGSSVLLSGTAGSGKSSVSAHLADATCSRGERCLYFSFEESSSQILRNMKSIGLNLEPHVRKGLLKFHSTRPTVHGLEMHLVLMHKLIEEFRPSAVVIDPVSNIRSAGTAEDANSLLVRLIDFLRARGITAFLVSLTKGGSASLEGTDEGISSMVDTWLLLRDIEQNGERNRLIYILKSRGMAHSNQVREFLITSKGIRLIEAYLGAEGVLTGSARRSQEARERIDRRMAEEELARRRLGLEHRRKALEAQIEALRASFRNDEQEFERYRADRRRSDSQAVEARRVMAQSRKVKIA